MNVLGLKSIFLEIYSGIFYCKLYIISLRTSEQKPRQERRSERKVMQVLVISSQTEFSVESTRPQLVKRHKYTILNTFIQPNQYLNSLTHY